MALSIDDPEADRLARALAKLTGESLTESVTVALRERLAREAERRGRSHDLRQRLEALAHRARRLPVYDDRSADAIIGYDERGLPR
ncbi:MAG: antitoxin [Geminicoccaceae bacterium]|nr:MAG: antitoxin [Geminicoccaceae bacterium]